MLKSNLREIMKEKKETILGLAARADVAKKSIDRARGTLISESRMSTLEAIAKALGVRVKDLFDEIPDLPAGEEQAAGLAKAGGNGYCTKQEGSEC